LAERNDKPRIFRGQPPVDAPRIATDTDGSAQIHSFAGFVACAAQAVWLRLALLICLEGAMRFFTEHFLTEAEKSARQQRKNQLEQEYQFRLNEIELSKFQRQLEQLDFDRNAKRVALAVLVFVIFAMLLSGVGMSYLLGDI